MRGSSLKNERKVLKNKSILLGVTGGIAAYKSVDLLRRLKEKGANVTVIMTDAAKKFITPLTLEVVSQNKVYSELFTDPLSHVSLSANADVMVIAPATANIIGKLARGIADDLLSTSFLSFKGKIIIAPSMNWRMYENPAVQENLNIILSRGIILVGPEKGALACGEEGMGRMADTSEIIEHIEASLTEQDLSGENFLITAGPTREYIDSIRFISNRSSGKMGYALAKAALQRGAKVTLISGPSSLPYPKGVKFINVETSEEMLKAVRLECNSSSVFIMAAAVSDFKPTETAGEKIEKSQALTLRLIQAPDIITEIGKKNKRPFIIGFAAETGKKISRAREKLKRKNMDMIIFNDVTEAGSGFEVDTNKVVIIDTKKEIGLPIMSKDSVAHAILDRLIELRT